MSFRLRMIYLKISQSKYHLVIADVYGSLFVLFHLAIVSYVLLRTSDYLIGIFKLFWRSDKVKLSFASCLSFVSRYMICLI
jgi:hypothetical protein